MLIRRNDYKYQLDTSSRKELCPHCGHKTFVLYLDREGKALSSDVGKCDRKDNCNWHYPPKAYFRDNALLASEYTRAMPTQHHAPPVIHSHNASGGPSELFVPPDFIKPKVFEKTLTREQRNPLNDFLHTIFEPHLTKDQISAILIGMGVGTAKQFGGSPVFWQMDITGRLRTGKIMGYDAKTGKRIKKPTPQFQWVHKLIKNKDFKLQQSYFGSHNLTDKNAVIGLFESEKAAVIMALALRLSGESGRFVPIACGGADGLNPTADKMKDPFDALQALKRRKIILFPDEGKTSLWKSRGEALKGFCKEIYISLAMEDKMRPFINCSVSSGDAVDDIVISYLKKQLDVAKLIRILCDEAEENRLA